MTVIAYKNRAMVSDGRCTATDLIVTDKMDKLAKGPGVIGGFAGDSDTCNECRKWVQEGADLQNPPKKTTTGLVAYDKDGKTELYRMEDNGYFQLDPDDFHVIGSGKEIAIGALSQGATLKEAVRVTAKYITSCGGKIREERL